MNKHVVVVIVNLCIRSISARKKGLKKMLGWPEVWFFIDTILVYLCQIKTTNKYKWVASLV